MSVMMPFIPRYLFKAPVIVKHERCVAISRQVALASRCCSSSSNAEDEPARKAAVKKKNKEKKQAARIKLDELLSSIKKITPSKEAESGGVWNKLARPGAEPRPHNVVRAPRPAEHEQKDLGTHQHSEETESRPRKKSKKLKKTPATLTLDEEVAQAAREVASTLGGDTQQTEMDLLRKLSGEEQLEGQPTGGAPPQLSELISNMQVTPQQERHRADQVRGHLGRDRARDVSKVRRSRPGTGSGFPLGVGMGVTDVDLHSGPALDIFPDPKQTPTTEVAETGPASAWERIHQREMQLSVTHPPANGWEQMILWTEQGKLWTLPVNNEAGLEAEAAIGFHEHVFLEGQLEPWCPAQGPVRHFMELVCVGLGKNPWLSIAEKHEHIVWFREYFAGKHELLAELKAV